MSESVYVRVGENTGTYAAMGSLEFGKKLLNEAKVCVSPGIGFGDYGDTHVRFAPDREPGPYAPGDPRYQGDVPRGWSAGLRELALRAARQNKKREHEGSRFFLYTAAV